MDRIAHSTVLVAVILIAQVGWTAAPVAKVERYHGEPAIMIGGKAYPPMMMTFWKRQATTDEWRRGYYQRLGAAGFRIFFTGAATDWLRPGDPAKRLPSGFESTVREAQMILDAVPDAYVVLRFNVSPPKDWVNAHPEEQIVFSDGKPRRCICTSVSKEPIDGMHSLCSGKWREEGDRALTDFFRKLDATPVGDRVVGAFLMAAGTGEWYNPQPLVNADGTYGDFSQPFRCEYGEFLRQKYGSVEELRRAWGREDATFENPLIPKPEDRTFAWKADERIVQSLHDWERFDREIGNSIDLDGKGVSNVGVFLNYNKYRHVADFYTAWHRAPAQTIVHFARTLKRVCPNRLVGAFYGSFGCQDYFDGGTASGTLEILDSGAVDFLAAPGVYNNREPGGLVAQREMQDSFRLRNLIYVCEDDSRTHFSKPWVQRDAMGLYSSEESVKTLKRDFARNLCEDIQSWWYDMGPGWYDDPAIYALFRRQQEIAAEAFELDRTKRNEIALIYDTESVHIASQKTSDLVLDFWRTTDLARIGAPVDYYFHDDLANPRMPDYKLYVMVNQYCLSGAEREAVYAKARRNGATVLWMYAPGFVDPDAAKAMCAENISKTVGMNVAMSTETRFPHYKVDPSAHPALASASGTRRYGIIDRDIHSNIWLGNVLQPAFANPIFAIDDPNATVLGRYCHDGRAALALVETNGVKSVYSAAQVMRSDLLASIAEWSGCHLFEKGVGDVLYANENYVCVHASSDGKRTIRFKRRCSPYEVYEKRFYGHDVMEIAVEMKTGDTLMWQTR